MQTVGSMLMIPTGGPVNAGSQLNIVHKDGSSSFVKLLNNVIGQAVIREGSQPDPKVGSEGTMLGRLIPELVQLVEEGTEQTTVGIVNSELVQLVKEGTEQTTVGIVNSELVQLVKDLQELRKTLKQEFPGIPGMSSGSESAYEDLKSMLIEISGNIEQLVAVLSQENFLLKQQPDLEPIFHEILHGIQGGENHGLTKMSGEINQLLNLLKSFTKELAQTPKSVDELRKFTAVLESTGSQLAEVLEDIKGQLRQQQAAKTAPEQVQTVAGQGSTSEEKGNGVQVKESEGELVLQKQGQGQSEESGDTRESFRLEAAVEKLNKVIEKLNQTIEKATGKTGITLHEARVQGDYRPETLVNNQSFASPAQGEAPVIQNTPVFTRMAETIRVFQTIMESVSAKAKLIQTPEQSQLTIQLHPESLGKLQMKVTVENGLVTAKFAAETLQVKELLEANLNNLRQSLAEQGIKVDQLEVGLSSQKEFQMFDRGTSRENQSSSVVRRYFGTEVSAAPVERLVQTGYFPDENTIDYTV